MCTNFNRISLLKDISNHGNSCSTAGQQSFCQYQQEETLGAKYNVILGDLNHDLQKHPRISAFNDYEQLIQQPTTSQGTLLDHIYIKPTPQEFTSAPMTSYYSYHEPIFVAMKP